MSFLKNKPPAGASAQPAVANRPPPRDPNRYLGLRTTTETAKLLKGDYGITVVSSGITRTRSGDMFVLALDVTDATTGSANGPGRVEVARPAVTEDQMGMVLKIVLGVCMAASGCKTEAEFFEKYPADEQGKGGGADLIDRVLGHFVDEDVFGANPLEGAGLRVEAFNGNKIDPKTGQPYVNLRFYPAEQGRPEVE